MRQIDHLSLDGFTLEESSDTHSHFAIVARSGSEDEGMSNYMLREVEVTPNSSVQKTRERRLSVKEVEAVLLAIRTIRAGSEK